MDNRNKNGRAVRNGLASVAIALILMTVSTHASAGILDDIWNSVSGVKTYVANRIIWARDYITDRIADARDNINDKVDDAQDEIAAARGEIADARSEINSKITEASNDVITDVSILVETAGVEVTNNVGALVNGVGTQVGNVEDRLWDVHGQLTSLVEDSNFGKDLISGDNIQGAIEDAVTMIQQGLPTQAEMDAFESVGCPVFKTGMMDLNDSMFMLAGTLAGIPDVGFTLPIKDPGLSNAIDSIPCKVLLPVSLVMGELGLDGEIIINMQEMFEDVSNDLSNISLVISAPTFPDQCTALKNNEDAIWFALKYVQSVALLTKLVGAVLESMGETVLAGPTEADVGAWGFAGVTVKSNSLKAMGEFFSGSAGVISSLHNSVSGKQAACEIDALNLKLQLTLNNIDSLLSSQQDKFKGLSDDHAALLTAIDAIQFEYGDLGEEFASLQAAQQQMLAAHAQQQGEHASLSGDHLTLLSGMTDLQNNHQELLEQHALLQEDHDGLSGDLSTLIAGQAIILENIKIKDK